MSAMTVLVAEDKLRTAQILERALVSEGYSVSVAFDGEHAFNLGKTREFSLILLDIMLPRMDGLSVLRELRARGLDTPAIIVTARDAMADIVRGLDLGADDYLTKPFMLDVLLARVRAAARRGRASTAAPDLRFEDITLCAATHQLCRGNRTQILTRTEFALLKTLMSRPGAIVPRDVLVEAGWGAGAADVNENTLYVFMRGLRAKIAQNGEKQLLRNVRGVGYTLQP